MMTVGVDTGIGPQGDVPGIGGVLFEPRIVGFLCRWCSYPGADLAGTSRLAYSPSLRVIRVPCSGRVDPLFVLKAFQDGADGVMVLGWACLKLTGIAAVVLGFEMLLAGPGGYALADLNGLLDQDAWYFAALLLAPVCSGVGVGLMGSGLRRAAFHANLEEFIRSRQERSDRGGVLPARAARGFWTRMSATGRVVATPSVEGVEALLNGLRSFWKPLPHRIVHLAMVEITGRYDLLPDGDLEEALLTLDREAVRKIWFPWWEHNRDRLVDADDGIGFRQDDGTVEPLARKKDDE